MRIDWHFPSPLVLDALDVSLISLAFILFLMILVLARRPKGGQSTPDTEKMQDEPEALSQIASAQAQTASEPVQKTEAADTLRDLSPDAAFQVLALLQQEARFIDFLSEDLTGHGDADIGAVARVVHEGGRRVLDNYFELSPIRSEDEESQIEVPSGFDAQAIRLTGNVTGQPPYRGTLTHRGWRVSDVKLPKISEGHEAAIIAPAEVEV